MSRRRNQKSLTSDGAAVQPPTRCSRVSVRNRSILWSSVIVRSSRMYNEQESLECTGAVGLVLYKASDRRVWLERAHRQGLLFCAGGNEWITRTHRPQSSARPPSPTALRRRLPVTARHAPAAGE